MRETTVNTPLFHILGIHASFEMFYTLFLGCRSFHTFFSISHWFHAIPSGLVPVEQKSVILGEGGLNLTLICALARVPRVCEVMAEATAMRLRDKMREKMQAALDNSQPAQLSSIHVLMSGMLQVISPNSSYPSLVSICLAN